MLVFGSLNYQEFLNQQNKSLTQTLNDPLPPSSTQPATTDRKLSDFNVFSEAKIANLYNGNFKLPPVSVHEGKKAVVFQQSTKTHLIGRLNHVLVAKFSHGHPSPKAFYSSLKRMNIKGDFAVSKFDNKHMFIELKLFEDFVYLWLYKNLLVQGFPVRMFKWTANFNPDSESSVAPVWVHLPRLPLFLYEEDALLTIANAFGSPLFLDPKNLNRTQVSYATFCVELDVTAPPSKDIWIDFESDASGLGGNGFIQHAFFSELPSYCISCNHLGHMSSHCKRKYSDSKQPLMGMDDINQANICPALIIGTDEIKEDNIKGISIHSGGKSLQSSALQDQSRDNVDNDLILHNQPPPLTEVSSPIDLFQGEEIQREVQRIVAHFEVCNDDTTLPSDVAQSHHVLPAAYMYTTDYAENVEQSLLPADYVLNQDGILPVLTEEDEDVITTTKTMVIKQPGKEQLPHYEFSQDTGSLLVKANQTKLHSNSPIVQQPKPQFSETPDSWEDIVEFEDLVVISKLQKHLEPKTVVDVNHDKPVMLHSDQTTPIAEENTVTLKKKFGTTLPTENPNFTLEDGREISTPCLGKNKVQSTGLKFLKEELMASSAIIQAALDKKKLIKDTTTIEYRAHKRFHTDLPEEEDKLMRSPEGKEFWFSSIPENSYKFRSRKSISPPRKSNKLKSLEKKTDKIAFFNGKATMLNADVEDESLFSSDSETEGEKHKEPEPEPMSMPEQNQEHEPSDSETVQYKRGRGRPQGSKNKTNQNPSKSARGRTRGGRNLKKDYYYY